LTTDEYGEGVGEQLDAIEFDDSKRQLWNVVADTINLILDNPDSREARQNPMISSTGATIWRVSLKGTGEDQNWSVMWGEIKPGPQIVYVGPWPPLS
jgi:hypothetical protein